MTRKPRPAAKKTAKPRRATAAPKRATKAAPKRAIKAAAPSTVGIEPALVRDLAHLLSDSDLTEIEVQKGDLRIRVARETRVAMMSAPAPVAVNVATAAPAATAAAPAPADNPNALKSPMVGTAYRRPSPDAKPFVEVGQSVQAGDKVLLVEAMKTFNEILAHRGGVVTEVLIEDGQPVEYGQALLIIE